ncbi:response regulator transcription factor [Pseudothauera nasutitermitis]|uniref:Response regulator transcription factor n=1 Tax=Pseudothauera nasutitermitis TaxID=2565930 RepID=A0A4S4B496_9RHOO|nr:response regulator transcription factor [Pseudothauera nasutitermitis]THF67405.1 response regulator transcription factor [Pseudothauera nasutitermitis]
MPSNKQQIPYTVLIVEDEHAIAENLFLALESEGFIPDIARDARSALEQLGHESFDLVLLDIGLPGMDGYHVLKQMREALQLSTPVLLLTARTALEDKQMGFSGGADDYLTKPFALEEVLMRAKALIRRSKQLSDTAFVLKHGPLRYVVADQLVTVNGCEVKLSRKSLMILELLMRYAGRVVPRKKLEDYLWQGEPPSSEALRSQFHLLRKALHTHGYDGIETVHSIGWRLVDSHDPQA